MSTFLTIFALLLPASVVYLAGVWTGRRIEHSRHVAEEEARCRVINRSIAERTRQREADLFVNGGSIDPIAVREIAKAFHVPKELIVNPNDLPHWQELGKVRIKRNAE